MSNNNTKYRELDCRGGNKGANPLTSQGQAIPLRSAYRQPTRVLSGLDQISGYKDNIEYWIRTMVRDPEKTARLLDLLERRWFEDGTGEGGTTRDLQAGAGCDHDHHVHHHDEIELEAVEGQRVLGNDSPCKGASDKSDADVSIRHRTAKSSQYKGGKGFSRQDFVVHPPVIVLSDECTPWGVQDRSHLDDASLNMNSDTITPGPVENRANQDDIYDDTPTGCSQEEADSMNSKIGTWGNTADAEGQLSGEQKEPQHSTEITVISARSRSMWTESRITVTLLKPLPLLALSIAISLWFHALLVAEILKDMLRYPITGFKKHSRVRSQSQEAHSISS